jgi:hypothetical protein
MFPLIQNTESLLTASLISFSVTAPTDKSVLSGFCHSGFPSTSEPSTSPNRAGDKAEQTSPAHTGAAGRYNPVALHSSTLPASELIIGYTLIWNVLVGPSAMKVLIQLVINPVIVTLGPVGANRPSLVHSRLLPTAGLIIGFTVNTPAVITGLRQSVLAVVSELAATYGRPSDPSPIWLPASPLGLNATLLALSL